MVRFSQLSTDFRLIIGSFPIHIENLIFGAENRLGISMALHTPLHQQRICLQYQRHLIDLPVASRAAHTFVDMNAVIEINEIGQAMNFDPLDGLVAAIALANGLEVRRSVEENRMAIHAGLRRRDTGHGGSFDAGMAVAAVDAVIADVVFMAELHWLLTGGVLPRQVTPACHPLGRPQTPTDQE